MKRLPLGLVDPPPGLGVMVNVTTAPPAGAGAERKTNPLVVVVPACITVGVIVIELTPAGVTVRLACLVKVVPLITAVAVIGTTAVLPVGLVLMATIPWSCPAGIVIGPGAITGEFAVNVIVWPVPVAGWVSVI